MFYTYVLKSRADSGYYIGSTNNIEKRLVEHNDGDVTSTRPRRPFVIAHIEEFHSRGEAMKRELFLKKNYRARKDLFEGINFETI